MRQFVPICANLRQFVPIVTGGLEIRKPRPILVLCTPKSAFYATPFVKKKHSPKKTGQSHSKAVAKAPQRHP